jgi:hypothetical protein
MRVEGKEEKIGAQVGRGTRDIDRAAACTDGGKVVGERVPPQKAGGHTPRSEVKREPERVFFCSDFTYRRL